MSGWAGAGAFSDGKLSLSEEVGGNITDYLPRNEVRALIQYADSIYLQHGAPPRGLWPERSQGGRNSIRVYAAQHPPDPLSGAPLGTEKAFTVLRNMYETLMGCEGFEFRERTSAQQLLVENGKVAGVYLKDAAGEVSLARAKKVVPLRDAVEPLG